MITGSASEPSASPALDVDALRRPVIVGVDDSPASLAAARWAAAEAATLGVCLHLIGIYVWGLLDPWTNPADPLILAQQNHGCDKTISEVIATLRQEFPDLDVSGEVLEADPRQVLAERGNDASMVVVGTRHLRTFGRAVLGSVSTHLSACAPCPVIVLCGPSGPSGSSQPSGRRPAVVVGVTGEVETDGVLEFAFAQAQTHQLPLHAVLCWQPLIDAEPWGAEPPTHRAERWLAEALAGWRERYPDVAVQASLIRDHAVSGLVSASSEQHLLVVGRHSRRTRFGTLLGSVSQGVVHHASCPVAVVPVRV